MRKQRPIARAGALFLAMMMAVGAAPLSAFAADEEKVTLGTTGIEQVKEILNASTYEEYLLKNADKVAGTDKITIDATAYDAENTNAAVTVGDAFGRKALSTPDSGTVSWKINVAKEGMYNIGITYANDVEKSSSIERILRVDGKIPFKEARYLTMTKVWRSIYEDAYYTEGGSPWRRDIHDNDIRPRNELTPEWRTVLFEDSSCFYIDPFKFYLTAGEHTLSLEASRESLYIAEIQIATVELPISYEQYLEKHKNDPVGTATVRVQAETPVRKSDVVIYPLNDRSSAITEPQDAAKMRLNSIGDDKWKLAGEWLRWEINVPAAGMYYIVPRFKQPTAGVYSSRRMRLNGEIPFYESQYLRFIYQDIWQTAPLSDGKTEGGFMFYLNEGTNVLELEVNLGDMADLLRRVEASLANMNSMYLKVLMITGPTPDNNRDYGFERLIPDVVEGMQKESANLYSISEELISIIGQRGQDSVILDKIALQLEKMGTNVDKIAPNLGTYKTNIGSLGTWLLERRNQPLQLDYIQVQPAADKKSLPRAEANFFQAAAHELKAFVLSFFNDYSSIGETENLGTDKKDTVQVWLGSGVASGREQAQIIRQMIDDTFTSEYGVRVNLKLVAAGTLLPATLSGTGPDVAITMNGGDAINYAIRGAVLPLNDFEGFDEVTKRFSPSAMVPLTFNDERHEAKGLPNLVYGLPENQTFPMMFYRKDILANLNLELPKTWEDLFAIIPDLQKNKLDVGITPGLGPILMFMFQRDEPLYWGDGIKVNLDSNVALDSFKKMTDLYTMYKFPITFDFANRFRTGEMPIGIVDYSTYNQLTVFAPEIRGLWEFYPLPGTLREKKAEDAGKGYEELVKDGTTYVIDNDSVAGVTTVIMMSTAQKRGEKRMQDSWKFMNWWTSSDSQGTFGTEMIAVMGPAAKQPTANLDALNKMPWPTTDLRNLQAQFAHLAAAPEVPGSYILTRYVDNSWKAVYNNGVSPIETILDNVPEIDKELSRKRKEFDMRTMTKEEAARANVK